MSTSLEAASTCDVCGETFTGTFEICAITGRHIYDELIPPRWQAITLTSTGHGTARITLCPKHNVTVRDILKLKAEE